MNETKAPPRWLLPAILALLAAGYVFLIRGLAWADPAATAAKRTVRFPTLRDLPLTAAQNVKVDPLTGLVHAGERAASIDLHFRRPPSVTHLAIRLQAKAPFATNGFVLRYYPAGQTDRDAFIDVARGTPVGTPDRLTVVWHLPRPITHAQLDLPPGAEFLWAGWPAKPGEAAPIVRPPGIAAEEAGEPETLPALEAVADVEVAVDEERPAIGSRPDPGRGAPSYALTLVKLLLVALLVATGLLAAHHYRPAFALTSVAVKKVLLLALGVHYATMIFMLPPFQGPDEYLHFRTALERWRPDALQEYHLHGLYDLTGVRALPFQAENQLAAGHLRADPGDRIPPQEAEIKVTYATPLTHPFVAVVALVFPRVETPREALVFYFLCRLLPGVTLLAVLWWLNRRGDLPYVLLVFFSFPLVTEQVTVVSSDPLILLGTLTVAVLYVAARRRPRPALTVALYLLTLLVILGKPPVYAGLLLLPALTTPWHRFPRKAIWVPTLILGVAAVGSLAAYYGVRQLHGGSLDTPEAHAGKHRLHAQWRFLTQDPEGFDLWAQASLGRVGHLMSSGASWYRPLGWIDTDLSPFHQFLIGVCFWLAVLMDLVDYGPPLARAGLTRWPEAVFGALIVIAVFLFLAVTTCLIQFLISTPVVERPLRGTLIVYGVQMRYFFPVGILALVLPLAILAAPLNASPEPPPAKPVWEKVLGPTVALSVFPLLFLGRQVELVVDLLARYW